MMAQWGQKSEERTASGSSLGGSVRGQE